MTSKKNQKVIDHVQMGSRKFRRRVSNESARFRAQKPSSTRM